MPPTHTPETCLPRTGTAARRTAEVVRTRQRRPRRRRLLPPRESAKGVARSMRRCLPGRVPEKSRSAGTPGLRKEPVTEDSEREKKLGVVPYPACQGKQAISCPILCGNPGLSHTPSGVKRTTGSDDALEFTHQDVGTISLSPLPPFRPESSPTTGLHAALVVVKGRRMYWCLPR